MRGTDRGRLEGDRRVLQVSDVLRAIEDQFAIAFPRRVWVFGTVRGLRGGDDLEFLLTEASAELTGDETPRTLPSELDAAAHQDVDASLRRLHDVAVEDLLVEDHLIRAGGLLSYDTTRHTVVFSVTALDPQPTSAWLDDRRRAVREAVDEARLSERQGDVQIPLAPRRVGIVAAAGDPTLDEVRGALLASGFAFDVSDYRVRETGARTADGIATALREATRNGHDVVLLVRRYGRPLALAPYDDEAVIRAVATAGVPVLTGLGSPEVPAAVESVAHQAYPTAGELAEALVRKLHRADALVDDAVDRVVDSGDEALRRAGRRVEQVRSEVLDEVRAARTRAEAARRKRLLLVRSLAGLLAVVILLVGILTGAYALLALLGLPLGLVMFGDRFRTQRRRTPVAVRDLTFAAALQRLGTIRSDLADVADADAVDALESEAEALAEHCRQLLRRPRKLRRSGEHAADAFTDAPTERHGERAESHLFDQFAGAREPDDATVSLPRGGGTSPSPTDGPSGDTSRHDTDRHDTGRDDTGRDDSGRDDTGRDDTGRDDTGRDDSDDIDRDAPTDAVPSGPRTITLPGDGDATEAIPTVSDGGGTDRTSAQGRTDDAPTSILPPHR